MTMIYRDDRADHTPHLVPAGVVTADQAAEKSGYTPTYVRRLAARGTIKGSRFGYQWMIDLESLLAYKARTEAEGSAKHARRYDDAEADV